MIGVDLVSIARIERFLERFGDKALARFLTNDEIANVKRVESIAGLWAAKEAIAKALGCGIGSELGFHDIIISKTSKGAPTFRLTPQKEETFKIKDRSLSISHDGGFAIAVAAIELLPSSGKS